MLRARFAAQLQVLQAAREAAHQRLDVARMLGPVEIAKVRRRERFVAARAVPRGERVVVAVGAARRRRRRRPRSPSRGAARRRGPAPRQRVAGDEDGLVRRQEVGIEQGVEAPPFVAAAAQQRLAGSSAGRCAIEHARPARAFRARRATPRRPRRSRWRAGSRRSPSSRACRAAPGSTRPGQRAINMPQQCGRRPRA